MILVNKKNIKLILAPIGVATGVTLWVTLLLFICSKLEISKLTGTFKDIPHIIFLWLGIVLVIIWLPVFISGFYFLGRRGAVGQSETLRENGIYRYVRNPMYSGLSFTIIGVGLILDKTGVVLAGIIWFLIAFIQCKREEKELKGRFKEDYVKYKSKTPMFIPNVKLMIRDLFVKRNKQK